MPASSTPSELFERREGVRQLVSAIQQLPQRQRDAIVLREFEGRSYEEMASRLSISDGAVAQLLNRARLHLRSAVASVTAPFLTLRLALVRRGARGRMEPVAAASGGAGGLGTVVKVSAVLLAGGGIAATGSHVAFDAPIGHAARHGVPQPHVVGAQRSPAGGAGVFGRSGPWSLGARDGRSGESSSDGRRLGNREDSGSGRGLSGSPVQRGHGEGSDGSGGGGSTSTPGDAGGGRGSGSDSGSGSSSASRGDGGGSGLSGRDSSGGGTSGGSGDGGRSSESPQLSSDGGGGGGSTLSSGGPGGSSGESSSSGDGATSGSSVDGGGRSDGGSGSGSK